VSYVQRERVNIVNEQLLNKVIHGDCLEWLPKIEDKSIDAVICDLPYGTTWSDWDKEINSKMLWEQYERVIKNDGVIVLFSSGSFTYKLIQSNENLYRYKWIWEKNYPTNFINAKRKPLSTYEEILVFSRGKATNHPKADKIRYNPQGLIPIEPKVKSHNKKFGTTTKDVPSLKNKSEYKQEFTNYPKDILKFNAPHVSNRFHTNQKPIDLVEYLIKTYTNEGETVLDNCLGSGTTAIACVNTNRNFIGIEKEWGYCEIANKRINEAKQL
jgi:site-specific DNA-methyltransferase (adenine-specific)